MDASRLRRTCSSHWVHRAGQERWIDQLVLPNQKESFGILWEIVTVQKFWLDTPFIVTLLFYLAKGGGEATLSPRAPVGCTAPHPPDISCGSWLLRSSGGCALYTVKGSRGMVFSWLIQKLAQLSEFVSSFNIRF